MADLAQVLAEALELSEHDRALLVARLLESLEGPPDPDYDEAWAAEIERRCAAIDAGELETHPWEELRERIEREIFKRGS